MGANIASSKANSQQTNALGNLRSTGGDTTVTVTGNTALIGGAITSKGGTTNLTTATLTSRDLTDSATSSSMGIGISGIGGSKTDAAGVTKDASNPGISFSTSGSNKQGMTFSVVSPGTITLTAPGADRSVLATLKRDPNGRQIVTVDDHYGFKIDISLSDFQALQTVATSATNLLTAITTAMPGDVSAAGPGAVGLRTTMMALGVAPEQIANDPEALIEAAAASRQQSDAEQYYAGRSVPTSIVAATSSGERISFGDPEAPPIVAIGCDTACERTDGVAVSDGAECDESCLQDVNYRGQRPAVRMNNGNGRPVEFTVGQMQRLDNAVRNASDALDRVAELDPTWRPQGGLSETAEGSIRTAEGIRDEAEARYRDLMNDSTLGSRNTFGQRSPASNGGPPLDPLETVPNRSPVGSVLNPGNLDPQLSLPDDSLASSGGRRGNDGSSQPVDPATPGAVPASDGNFYANQAQADHADDAFHDANPDPVYPTIRGSTGDWNAFANNPQPNTVYQFDNGYKYQTDAQGRVANVEAFLEYDPWARNGYQQGKAADCGNSGDCGGHLIASMFGGPGEAINLVPMDATLNGSGGAWYALEQVWLKALSGGQTVQVQIAPTYGPAGQRPNAFEVSFSIGGGPPVTRSLKNTPSGN
jgi:hypothetical protein